MFGLIFVFFLPPTGAVRDVSAGTTCRKFKIKYFRSFFLSCIKPRLTDRYPEFTTTIVSVVKCSHRTSGGFKKSELYDL